MCKFDSPPKGQTPFGTKPSWTGPVSAERSKTQHDAQVLILRFFITRSVSFEVALLS